MNVITRKRLRAFAARHANAAMPLEAWYRTASKANWQSIQDVRRIYAHADAVKVASGNDVTVFNVSGNKYRLVTAIHYDAQRVYVLRLMTHAEYGKGKWRTTL
ncbi:MAG: type II toxin-antitoxin system HigB family toxin [Phycisphaerae bacterium]|nr:type II toxin-antitoxin system HigB family toxin [Phycisphaerae bacterium]